MLVSKLVCPSCGYRSDAFGDTRDFHSGTYSLVLQDLTTKRIVVNEVAAELLVQKKIDLDSPNAINLLQQHFGSEKAQVLKIPIGQGGVPVDVLCPVCGKRPLTKEVVGFQ